MPWELPQPRAGWCSGLFPSLSLPVSQSLRAAVTKIPYTWQKFTSHSPTGREGPGSRCWQIQCLMSPGPVPRRCPVAVSPCKEGARELSGVFLIRALIPFIRAPLSGSHHLPKAPPPGTITLGVRLPHMNLGDTASCMAVFFVSPVDSFSLCWSVIS